MSAPADPAPTQSLPLFSPETNSRRGLHTVACLTFIAVVISPLQQFLDGRLTLDAPTIVGGFAFATIPVLYFLSHRCARTETPTTAEQVMILAQLPLALLACWGLHAMTVPILLVIAAAQLPRRYPPIAILLLLTAANLVLAWLIWHSLVGGSRWSDLLGYVSFQAFAVMTVRYATQAERARDQLLLINAELLATRRLLTESARSEERLRLSRELHDVVGHKLTALKLQLRLLARDAATNPIVEDCMRLSDDLLTDVRGVVSTLRADEGIDLHAALSALVPAVPRPRIRLELAADARVPGVEQAQALLRCAQEGLTNALRHSDADHVVVGLARSRNGVSLSIEDDGGAQSPPRWGNGLNGMRERLQALGGVLEVAINGHHGLLIKVWLPLP